jgi:hypothetical protein
MKKLRSVFISFLIVVIASGSLERTKAMSMAPGGGIVERIKRIGDVAEAIGKILKTLLMVGAAGAVVWEWLFPHQRVAVRTTYNPRNSVSTPPSWTLIGNVTR